MCIDTCTNGKIVTDNLQRPINLDELNSTLWSNKCDYLYPSNCTNLNPQNYNLILLQHNVCSLLGNLVETKQLLQTLYDKNSPVNLLLLCETFLTKKMLGLVSIPGYSIVSNLQQNHKGGGTAILIKDGIPYKQRQDLDVFIEKHTESTFIEINTKNGMPVIIGSMYCTPNTPADEFIKHTTDIISKVKGEKKKKELIIGMDHNLDLLHSDVHQPTNKFLNTLLDMQLFPMVTRPSRIIHRMATLIDNIFESKKFHRDYDSAILVSDISDDLPLLCLLKQTKILNSL